MIQGIFMGISWEYDGSYLCLMEKSWDLVGTYMEFHGIYVNLNGI